MHPSFGSAAWPPFQPDPTILAAYNAALESLRSRPPFPILSNPAQLPQSSAASANGALHPQGLVPPFSLPPAMLQPGSQQMLRPPAGASGSLGTAVGSTSQQPGQQSHPVSQLYAPALTYVPVSLVQQRDPAAAQHQSAAAPPADALPRQMLQAQGLPPGFPYAPFGPMLPMMMPLGFHPFARPPAPHPQGFPQPNSGPPATQPVHPGFQGAAAQAGAAAAAAAQMHAAGRGGLQRPPQIRVRMIRINVKLLIQLCILGLIVYQNTSQGRFIKLVGGAVAVFFLWPMINRDNAVRRRIQQLMHPNEQRPGPGGEAAQPQARDQAQPAARPAAQQNHNAIGFIREIQALVVGFFTSLIPGLNVNPEDVAVFRQAQQIIAQEEANERNIGHPHRE